ncbi:DUF3558 domain-containing protein [Nocardia sp. NPDC019395]|uniref:DUF3558 domain-containing protein n=1 Tax=Nocardia sp. NPDC019395 TaxID=3154686 RepID=UPI0033DE1D59
MRAASKKYAGVVGKAVVTTAAVGLVAGCGPAGEEPAAEGASTTSREQHVEWNPCSELPDEALRATGADPASKDTDFDAPGDKAVWRMCAWDSIDGPYYIGVGATTYSQDDVRQNTTVEGFEPVQINDRSGLTFYPSGQADPIRRCYVSLPMEMGMLTVYVDWRYSQRDSLPESPPCGLAVEHAQTLAPFLPK